MCEEVEILTFSTMCDRAIILVFTHFITGVVVQPSGDSRSDAAVEMLLGMHL